MRIWSLHPTYLDAKGLVALWRETLLAQHVLLGKTKGYKNHPQLERFKEQASPVVAIGVYLLEVQAEATRRGYAFDSSKIATSDPCTPIEVADGQMAYEWKHLLRKLKTRDPVRFAAMHKIVSPKPHPLFTIIPGDIAGWERESDE